MNERDEMEMLARVTSKKTPQQNLIVSPFLLWIKLIQFSLHTYMFAIFNT